jgi:hypothetical protein
MATPSGASKALMDCFWKLADLNLQKRAEAAAKLLSILETRYDKS